MKSFQQPWLVKLSLVALLALLTIGAGASFSQDEQKPPDQQKEQIKQLLEDGNRLLQEQDYRSAEDKFKEILSIDPTNPMAHNNLGLVYKKKELYFSAKEEFELALDAMPNYYKALNNLGNTLFAMERYEEARDAYLKALEIKPDFPEAHWNLALTYEKLDNKILALKEWRSYIADNNGSGNVTVAKDHIDKILAEM
jgi:Tfp pilus assembly protein PilF